MSFNEFCARHLAMDEGPIGEFARRWIVDGIEVREFHVLVVHLSTWDAPHGTLTAAIEAWAEHRREIAEHKT